MTRPERVVTEPDLKAFGAFMEPESWKAIVSGEASLVISRDGPALRFDYDFKGSGGFVVARREMDMTLPESYAIQMHFRGMGPANDLEWKWVDRQGASVWRHVRTVTAWPETWSPLVIRGSEIGYAWGPAGGGLLREVSALEIAIVAKDGGCGSIWLGKVELVDRTVREAPLFAASSMSPGHPAAAAGEALSENFWESADGDESPVWQADWRGERDAGGLAIRWASPSAPAFTISESADGVNWETLAAEKASRSRFSLVALPGPIQRHLRLRFQSGSVAIASVELVPVEATASREARFHSLAALAPRGWLPRYWLREQSYWTPVAPPCGKPRGLINEEGLVEASAGFFSLEPFLWHRGQLLTWADAATSQAQTDGWMPVPVVVWECGCWRLTIMAGATEQGFVVRYRLENRSESPEGVRFFLGMRPHQATPPWQAFRGFGGLGRLEELRADAIRLEPAASGFGVLSEAEMLLPEVLATGQLPAAASIEDPAGLVAGAYAWDWEFAPGEAKEVWARTAERIRLEDAVALWREIPAQGWRIEGGNAETADLALTLRAATAHVLVNREGPALHPGPRRYDRCWIRDGAGMARALLQSGNREPVRALLEWYAPYVREDGFVPCLVDSQGPDWLPEHDSQGQFVHIVAEYLRYGGERSVGEALWPVVVKTIDCLKTLREKRMTPEYRAGIPPHRFGLLPESASHEGYLAHPVHSYWDDFWALRGLQDAVWLASELGQAQQEDAWRALSDDFGETLAASLQGLIRDRGLEFVPGSVEWADFDPSATANGVTLLEEIPGVSKELLDRSYVRYLERFRGRIDGTVPWDNYSAYEIRIAGALLVLGWRKEALEALRFFLSDRRPVAWNQWPEISWRNLRSPGHLGDVPHTWIAAEFITAARSMFVVERHRDDTLVIGAGMPSEWWTGAEGLTIRDWPVEGGRMTCSLRLTALDQAEWRVEGDLRVPWGGIVLAAELPGELVAWSVDGKPQPLPKTRLPVISHAPAMIQLEFGSATMRREYHLSRDPYEILITPHGTGQSRLGPLVLNRWDGDRLLDEQGFFLFLRDASAGAAWSATPKPCLRKGVTHEGSSVAGRVRWESRFEEIGTRLEVGCSGDGCGEVRRLEVTNRSKEERIIEVTSFLEVVLHHRDADANHPAFQKLFVQTERDPDTPALLAHRRPRGNDESWPWMVHRLDGTPVTQWETNRLRFLGRGRDAACPAAMEAGAKLSNETGNVLDACFSLRTELVLQPGESRVLTFSLGMLPTREAALAWRGELPVLAEAGTPMVISPVVAPSSRPREAEVPEAYAGSLRMFSGYGGFAADGTEYVIRLPWENGGPRRTPMPWCNCVANQRIGMLISESGAACTWTRNSQANRITPWSNDAVTDPAGEAFYLRAQDTGEYWSPLPGPAPVPAAYEVRHGWGYSTFRSAWDHLESELEFFVPVADAVRVVRWRLTNQADSSRRFALFGFHRLVLGTLPPEPGTIRVKAEAKLAALVANYAESSPFRGPCVFASLAVDGESPAGWSFTTDRAAFLGVDGGGMRQPMALRSGGPLGGESGAGLDACFAQRIELEIASGQTVEVVFLLGECDDAGALESVIAQFRRPGAAETMLSEVKTVWQTTLGGIQVETPMPGLDLMVNGWLSYQAIVSRLIARTAFYQSSGAFGFRDQLQDTHGLALLWPELTREQILRHARQQFSEGDVMHWWHPQPIGRGMRTRFSDDLLWLPYVAASYVNQTGDESIWDERVPYLQGPPLAEGQDEAYLESIESEETGTVYDHCCRAIDRSLKTGSHGLPLMGTGDWNDGMNRVGRLGKGESVWMAFFLGEVLQLMKPWCEMRSDSDRVTRYGVHMKALIEAVEKEAWDGEWYRRAYYDSGTPLGTASAGECQIDNLAQSWAVISRMADSARAKQAMQSAWERLVDREAGVVRLLAPSFAECPEDPGYIKGYVAGVRENGGQYTHAACWFAKALAMLGRNEDAAQVLEWLTPVWHARYREEADRYLLEPYVIAADIYHGEPHTGRGGWTWYTGSAAWFYRVALETLLGLSIGRGKELVLRPRVPASWPGFKVRYRHGHRGTVYEIQASRVATGVTVDGRAVESCDDGVRIPIEDDGRTHVVIVGLP